ncbi:50S ribosomal protein L10, partial [Candidatus Hydrogenedentota bacterium]
MPTKEKEAAVAEIKQKFEENALVILVQYQGTTVAEITGLRKELRDAGVDIKVYKNTLAKIAVSDMGFDEIKEAMEGPTAYAFAQEPAGASKIISNFAKANETFEVKGAVLDGEVISTAQVQALA